MVDEVRSVGVCSSEEGIGGFCFLRFFLENDFIPRLQPGKNIAIDELIAEEIEKSFGLVLFDPRGFFSYFLL